MYLHNPYCESLPIFLFLKRTATIRALFDTVIGGDLRFYLGITRFRLLPCLHTFTTFWVTCK